MDKHDRGLICRFCGAIGIEAFYPAGSTSGVSAGRCCKRCWVANAVEWRRKNSVRWNAKRHRRALFNRFGITDAQYDALYRDPVCAGCGVKQTTRRLCLDHDHVTGAVRGLLCHDCNRTLATAHDDPKILRRLARYLR